MDALGPLRINIYFLVAKKVIAQASKEKISSSKL
jgi:hypothetical protein